MSDKDRSSAPIEIELSFVVEDLESVIKRAEKLYSKPLEEITVDRAIYKNGGEFHIRSSEESRNGKKTHVISFKEDLLKQGVTSGMKKALEIEVNVSAEQQASLTEMFKLIGFNKTTRLTKRRTSFAVADVQVDLDDYDLPKEKFSTLR